MFRRALEGVSCVSFTHLSVEVSLTLEGHLPPDTIMVSQQGSRYLISHKLLRRFVDVCLLKRLRVAPILVYTP